MVHAAKPHGKSQVELKAMKMASLLSLVSKHNLAQHIHLNKRMKKVELVKALAAYEKRVPGKADVKVKAAAAPALGRGKRVKKPTDKMAALKKGSGKTSRPKIGMTYFSSK